MTEEQMKDLETRIAAALDRALSGHVQGMRDALTEGMRSLTDGTLAAQHAADAAVTARVRTNIAAQCYVQRLKRARRAMLPKHAAMAAAAVADADAVVAALAAGTGTP